MSTSEIIIGRDPQTQQLRITVGKQSRQVGNTGSVPLSVSRQHVGITMNANGTYTLRNINSQNTTYVNDMPVERKLVTTKDIIRLGSEHYRLDWQLLMSVLPKQANLRHLAVAYDNYQQQMMALTTKERKFNTLKGAMSIFTMSAMLLGFLGLNGGEGERSPLLIGLYVVALLIGVGTTIWSFIYASKIPQERDRMQKEFEQRYCCPNCGYYYGVLSYNQLKLRFKQCPNCKTQYSF
ncbi:MAG: FHA domain-containing protein [Bacteroidaceae bacterium]|nr:FHA domain-containing protein [Bacteroidaceae bacterium]